MSPRLQKPAFTLIELLVVISIIALLIGILLPALGSARKTARMASCLSNCKQMSIATVNYATEHDMDLPTVGFSHGGETFPEQGSWFFLLEPYVDEKLMYRCPSDDSESWTTPEAGRLRRVSYATNFMLSGLISGGLSNYNNIDRLPRPSNTIYAVELVEAAGSGFSTTDHIHPETWFGNPATMDARVAAQVEIDQHLDRANYTYLDGHAATLARVDVFEVAPGATLFNQSFTTNHFWPDVAR
ncbi:MAG: DUF1559 domain-containing protein [Planctomycetota bacterium]